VLTPLVLKFMQQHPGLHIDLSFEDRYVNLVEQGIDVAVRMGRLADSSLGSLTLGHNPWVLVGAPAYLAAHGVPDAPADLGGHAALIYSSVQGDERWSFTGPDGAAVSVGVKGPLRSNNLSALLSAARQGMGLAVLPWYVAHASVQAGVVQPLLSQWVLPGQEVHAVYPSPRLVPTKVSGFSLWLQGQLTGDWWLRRL
jgi:DNA-binding transcriptional LysR family regulator